MKKFYAIIMLIFFGWSANAQWNQISYGDRVNCMVANGTKLYVGLQNNGVFFYNGFAWYNANFQPGAGMPSHIYSIAINGTRIVAGTEARMGFSGNLNGGSWTYPYFAGMVNNAEVYSLATSGSNIFAGTQYAMHMSSDYGSTFHHLYSGMPSYASVYSLLISGTNIFAGTNYGLFLTSDNCNNWTEVTNGLPPSGQATFYSLATSGSNIFAGTLGGGVFLSTDNGNNWTAINSGLTNTDVDALAISGTNIFAGTSSGVFKSTNNGSTWSDFSTGLTGNGLDVTSLVIYNSDIYAGTNNGVWYSSISMGIKELAINNEISISPNPFTSQTTISFNKELQSATIKIVDVVGKEVKNINFSGKEIILEKGELRVGVYFVQVQSEERIYNKKIIIQH